MGKDKAIKDKEAIRMLIEDLEKTLNILRWKIAIDISIFIILIFIILFGFLQ
jgi:hypothetical protein